LRKKGEEMKKRKDRRNLVLKVRDKLDIVIVVLFVILLVAGSILDRTKYENIAGVILIVLAVFAVIYIISAVVMLIQIIRYSKHNKDK
jgi:succinate-acetate transporter protein